MFLAKVNESSVIYSLVSDNIIILIIIIIINLNHYEQVREKGHQIHWLKLNKLNKIK